MRILPQQATEETSQHAPSAVSVEREKRITHVANVRAPLALASNEPPPAPQQQPALPGAIQSGRLPPFVVQCRASAVGSPGAMLVYIVTATFCDQYREDGDDERRRKAGLRDGEMACWPSLGTIRANCGGMGQSSFTGYWRELRAAGFVGTRYGSTAKVVRTLAAAMRARADGIADRTRPPKIEKVDRPVVVTGNDLKDAARPKGVGRVPPSKVLDAYHLTGSPVQNEKKRSVPVQAPPGGMPHEAAPPDHQDRKLMCRGCNRRRPARHVAQQHCDRCKHSTDDERRIVRDKVRAAIASKRREAGYGA